MGLVTFPNANFAVYSRSLQFYNAKNSDKSQKNEVPIDCIFCEFTSVFLVLSKNSFRVYSAFNGQLQKYFDFSKDEDLTTI